MFLKGVCNESYVEVSWPDLSTLPADMSRVEMRAWVHSPPPHSQPYATITWTQTVHTPPGLTVT